MAIARVVAASGQRQADDQCDRGEQRRALL
jgi:hypothetical protein